MCKISLHTCNKTRQTITAVLYTTKYDCDSCGFRHCNGNEERGFGGHLMCRKNTFFNSEFIYENSKVYSKELVTKDIIPLNCESILIQFNFHPEKFLVIPFSTFGENSVKIGFNSAEFCAVFVAQELQSFGCVTTITYVFKHIKQKTDHETFENLFKPVKPQQDE